MNYKLERDIVFKYIKSGEYHLKVNSNDKISFTMSGGGGGGGKNKIKSGGGGGGSGYCLINQSILNKNDITLNIIVGDGGYGSSEFIKKSTNGFDSIIKYNNNIYIAKGGLKGKNANILGGDGGNGSNGGDGGGGVKGGLGGMGNPGINGKTGGINTTPGNGAKGFHYESNTNSNGGDGGQNGKPGYVYIFITRLE